MMVEVKAQYREQQPMADIDSRLRDPLVREEEEHVQRELDVHHQLSDEPHRAFNALFTFAISELANECDRRMEAINAVTILSRHKEPSIRKACRKRQTSPTFAVGKRKRHVL